MAICSYWLSFTVASENSTRKGSESVRRKTIYAAAAKLDPLYWEETTSFILLEAVDNIDTVGRAVVAGLDPARDTVILRKVGTPTARHWGVIERPEALKSYIANIAPLT